MNKTASILLSVCLFIPVLVSCLGDPAYLFCENNARSLLTWTRDSRTIIHATDDVETGVRYIDLDVDAGMASSVFLPLKPSDFGAERVFWTNIERQPTGDLLLLSLIISPDVNSTARTKSVVLIEEGELLLKVDNASDGAWIDETSFGYLSHSSGNLFRGSQQSFHHVKLDAAVTGSELITLRKIRLGPTSSFVYDSERGQFWFETVAEDGAEAVAVSSEDARDIVMSGFACVQHFNRQQLSEDGLFVYSADNDNGVETLFTVDSNHLPPKPFFKLEDEHDRNYPTWSPDGTLLAFVINIGGAKETGQLYGEISRQIVVYDPASDESKIVAELEPSTRTNWPVWSPDGTQLAFLESTETETRIGVYRLSDGDLQHFSTTK